MKRQFSEKMDIDWNDCKDWRSEFFTATGLKMVPVPVIMFRPVTVIGHLLVYKGRKVTENEGVGCCMKFLSSRQC